MEMSLVLLALFSAFFLILETTEVKAGCDAGTDTWELRAYDPDDTLIATSPSITMSSKSTNLDDGDISDTACNVVNDYEENLSIKCQKAGTYYASIACTSCTVNHSAVGNTNVLTCLAPETNKFIIRNTSGQNIAGFDEKGFVYLKGNNYTDQGPLNPGEKAYVIRNNSKQIVAFIGNNGSLYLTGSIYHTLDATSSNTSSFVVRNGTKQDVAFINSAGNLYITGKIYRNWTDPI